jgi:hypothetical protein
MSEKSVTPENMLHESLSKGDIWSKQFYGTQFFMLDTVTIGRTCTVLNPSAAHGNMGFTATVSCHRGIIGFV